MVTKSAFVTFTYSVAWLIFASGMAHATSLSLGQNPKGINYDPAGADACSFGCGVDYALIGLDTPHVAATGASIVRLTMPAYPLINPSFYDYAQAVSSANTYMSTLSGDLLGNHQTPLLVIGAWNYTPSAGPGCPWGETGPNPPGSSASGCYNIVSKTYEPLQTQAQYQSWLQTLANPPLGAPYAPFTLFEIGNEANGNAFGADSYLNSGLQNVDMDPDSEPSGWTITDCQLDDPNNTIAQCDHTPIECTAGRNPMGYCDGREITWTNYNLHWDPKTKSLKNCPGYGNTTTWTTPAAPSAEYSQAVANYVQFVRDSASAIKSPSAGNSDATVILGGIASWHSACFIDQLMAPCLSDYYSPLCVLNSIDAVGFHPYALNAGPRDGASTVSYLKSKLTQVAQKWNLPTIPIWITEYGFDVNDTGVGGREAVKAQFIKSEWNLLSSITSGPILLFEARDAVASFNYVNPDATPVDTNDGYGIYEWTNNGTFDPLPSYAVFQALTAPTIALDPTNVIQYSQELGNAVWVGNNGATVSSSLMLDPMGSSTASFVMEDTSTGQHFISQQVNLFPNQAYTLSVYVKSATRQIQLVPFNTTDQNMGVVQCDPTTNSSSPSVSGYGSMTAAGNGWYRCSITFTPSISTSVMQLKIINQNYSYTGDGADGLYLWGVQLQLGSAPTDPSPYVETQGPATNLISASQAFDSSPWMSDQVKVRSYSQMTAPLVAPDGSQTSYSLEENKTESMHYLSQEVTLQPGETYTFSVYASSRSRAAELVAYNPTDGTLSDSVCSPSTPSFSPAGTINLAAFVTTFSPQVTGGSWGNSGNWFRCTATFTPSVANTEVKILLHTFSYSLNSSYTGNGISGLYLWGAQLENGATATAYVPAQ